MSRTSKLNRRGTDSRWPSLHGQPRQLQINSRCRMAESVVCRTTTAISLRTLLDNSEHKHVTSDVTSVGKPRYQRLSSALRVARAARQRCCCYQLASAHDCASTQTWLGLATAQSAPCQRPTQLDSTVRSSCVFSSRSPQAEAAGTDRLRGSSSGQHSYQRRERPCPRSERK